MYVWLNAIRDGFINRNIAFKIFTRFKICSFYRTTVCILKTSERKRNVSCVFKNAGNSGVAIQNVIENCDSDKNCSKIDFFDMLHENYPVFALRFLQNSGNIEAGGPNPLMNKALSGIAHHVFRQRTELQVVGAVYFIYFIKGTMFILHPS